MSDMMMLGGSTMSSAWMRIPGQTWFDAAASFISMWVVMMAAMMLPSLVPMLWRYQHAVGTIGARRLAALTAVVGAGYFFVWTLFGLAVLPLSEAVAGLEMRWPAFERAAPIAIGMVVVIASSLQFTGWKARRLAWFREAPNRGEALAADPGTAWRHGMCLGLHCGQSCAGLMAIVLAVGVMDLRAMTIVTAAITAERLAPSGVRVARVMGYVGVAAGLFLIMMNR